MGIINKDNVSSILLNCSNWLRKYINNLNNLTESEYCMIIVVLGQYLYAKYCTSGILKGDSYYIYPNDIERALLNTKFSKYSKSIIILRNYICHDFNSEDMIINMQGLLSNLDKLNDFLAFLFNDKSKTSVLDMMLNTIVENNSNRESVLSKVIKEAQIDVVSD